MSAQGTKFISLKRAAFPEQVGVSSAEIAAFIDDLEKSDIEAHSFMILREGKVAFETWREPYAPEIPHTMYSVSKAFTSTAVGFAISEGLMKLDDKVMDIFPEFRPSKTDVRLESMTIRHLLTMTAGKDVSLLADKSKNQWLKDFFTAKWYNSPGAEWRYISENCYVLCAAINRLAGMSVIEYLTPRLFEPLGFADIPFWESDTNGIEAGGWGLYVTTEDLAKLTLCYKQGGIFGGKQVIPEFWAREAVKKQVQNLRYHDLDNRAGYGYYFWMNGVVPNSYRMDGMFSQFAMVFEDYDAEFIITAGEIYEQKTRDCIWRHFPKVFIKPQKKAPDISGLKLTMTPLPELPAKPRNEGFEWKIEGRKIFFDKPVINNIINFPVSMLSIATLYMSADRAGNITDVEFVFLENECKMTWSEGGVFNTILCGMDGKPRLSKIHLGGIDFTMLSTAAWEDERTLEIWSRPREAVCQRRIKFTFGEDGVVIMTPNTVKDVRSMAQYISDEMEDFVKGEVIIDSLKAVMMQVYPLAEPIHKGHID